MHFRNCSVKALEMDQTDSLVGSAQNGVNFAQGRPKWRETESETEDEMGAKLGLFHPNTTWSGAGRVTPAYQPTSPPGPALCGWHQVPCWVDKASDPEGFALL